MELEIFTQMLSDKHALDFKKLIYKYGEANLIGYIETLKASFYQKIELLDFNSNNIVYAPNKTNVTSQLAKTLIMTYSSEKYSIKAMEEEIIATLSIEQVDTTRESVRRILNGIAPTNDSENKTYGIKRGLDYISDTSNKITEENLYKLYMLSCGDFLDSDDRLTGNNKYRDDEVFIVGSEVNHRGLDYKLLPEYMAHLIKFINSDESMDQIVKSTVIHYYIAYIHPYFDGNGRTARLLQLWYLVQKGYTASMFVAFSAYINANKSKYYEVFIKIMENYNISDVLDVTPFIKFFVDNVFSKLEEKHENDKPLAKFNEILKTGNITEKEKDLFLYILSSYGDGEFSTKTLEKDFKDVAYATVRSFVLKFEKDGLLTCQKYGNRVKYKLKN